MKAFGKIIEYGTVKMVNPFSSDKAATNIWQNFIEIADTCNEPGRFTAMTGSEWTSTPKENRMLQYEYARPALKLGLKLGKELGVNPYKFGLMGATDSHTALSTTREENYFGKYQQTTQLFAS